MMAVETERSAMLAMTRLSSAAGSVCLSVPPASTVSRASPPSPTLSCTSTSSDNPHSPPRCSVDPPTTQATLTVSVHSRPASPGHDERDSPPPSPLSPGDDRRRTPTPRAATPETGGTETDTTNTARRAEERVPPAAPHLAVPGAPQAAVRLTNFSIDAILKASFGAAPRRERVRRTGPGSPGVPGVPPGSGVRQYSPHGIDHLVHGHKYLASQRASTQTQTQTQAPYAGRAQGFVPYHPAAHRRTAPPSPPAARSPPLHHPPPPASTFPFTDSGPAAPSATKSPVSVPLASRHHYMDSHPHHQRHHNHQQQHHQQHPPHHPTPLHQPHHHQHTTPRSPGLTSSSASSASPAASPGAASSGGRSPGHKASSSSSSSSSSEGGSPGGGAARAAAGGGAGPAAGENAPTPAMEPKDPLVWPAWVYCTRYSDRPSSGRRKRRAAPAQHTELDPWEGPRARKLKKEKEKKPVEKRPRTAFTNEQLARLKREFDENRYLTETRRQDLAKELGLNESQIKIWFQNKRAKMKKATGVRNGLAIQLMAQGLYNHSTVPVSDDPGSDSASSPAKSS